MQKIVKFWQKDIVNKLIVILSLALIGGMAGLVALILNLPAGKSVAGAIGEIFPSPTLEPKMVLTRAAESALTQSAAATASVPPTITTMPFTLRLPSPTPALEAIELPTQTSIPPTATVFVPTPTINPPSATPVTPTATRFIPTATSGVKPPTPTKTVTPKVSSTSASDLACIPANPPQKGKVVDVLDGNTIKVLIDGLAYVVRYIGIEIPANPYYAKLAALTNGDLVFAEEVTLIPDVTDKDDKGRLLRYVKVGGKFPSIELLKNGLATAVDAPPNSACAKTYQSLEQAARDAKIGIWIPTPTLPAR